MQMHLLILEVFFMRRMWLVGIEEILNIKLQFEP